MHLQFTNTTYGTSLDSGPKHLNSTAYVYRGFTTSSRRMDDGKHDRQFLLDHPERTIGGSQPIRRLPLPYIPFHAVNILWRVK
jgi:hypothetical protein